MLALFKLPGKIMSHQPNTIFLKDYNVSNFIVDHIHLYFDIQDDATFVTAIQHLRRNPEAKNKTAPLVLDGEHMSLQRILVDGTELEKSEYSVDEKSLRLHKPLDQFVLETVVEIKPQENTALCGLYQSRHNLCTQCEAEGFRRITYSLDRPDVMTRFTTTISADKTKFPYLLSNGNLIEKRDLPDGRHWVKWDDPSKKPSYLFALVAGDFDLISGSYKTMSNRHVDLHLYVEKGFGDQAHFALEALKKAMKWDEDNYGREYDLNIYMIVAVSDFNMGAMENKGLNVFNTKYVLAKPETATDSDFIGIEQVIGHEYFHNWTGNRITCRDWFQLTLKEGLTVFRDGTFTEDMTSYGATRLDEVSVVRDRQFAEDRGPMAHPIRPQSYVEINNFYTSTVYRKGAEVIRMIRPLIGKENFRKAMDLYFTRHDGQAVTTDDFVQCMQDASGKDLTQFKRWYDQAGTPKLSILSEYNEKTKQFTLHVKQSCLPTPGQPTKEAFHLPLSMGLIGSHCADLLEGDTILEITEKEQVFEFDNIPEKPVVSLLRDFSAPVKISYPYTDEELLWLWQCDSDPFARAEAGQDYFTRLILKNEKRVPEKLVAAFTKLLATEHEDKRFQARLLILPSVSYLVQQTEKANVRELSKLRQFLRHELGLHLENEWKKIYAENTSGKYIYDMEGMGKRSLKNTALAYLTATEKPEYFDLAYQQFTKADNMTDTMGALLALNDFDCPERDKALDEFYAKWKDQPLVVNKWLLLHAITQRADALNEVKKCLLHPGFNIKNPNNVYALLSAFGDNVARFHDEKGEGYEFLAANVIELDGINPQVAARVVQPLTQWQQYAEHDQQQMLAALRHIAAQKNLSPDVYELVSKSL